MPIASASSRLGLDNAWACRAVAAADRAVGRVLEAVERSGLFDRATFVITGDHGSVDVHTALCPNIWLKQAGLTDGSESASVSTVAFMASGGAALLRLSGATGDTERVLPKVRAVLDALPPGVRALFRTVERQELDALGADPEAALALAAVSGVVFLADVSGAAIRAAHGAGHGYHPELPDMATGFVAAGAGIRPGAVIPMLPVEHIASIVAALLRLDLPDVDGTLLPGVLSTVVENRPSDRP